MTQIKLPVTEFINRFVGRQVWSRNTLVIAGHPGTGKTIIAASLCFERALGGHKCLFYSLQEDKETFFRNLEKVGIHLEVLEAKGLFKYVHLPVFTEEDLLREFTDRLNEEVGVFRPELIVIDSITPVLDVVGDSPRARAYLQNYFYNLSKAINGTLVLIAEVPLGEETIRTGSIEFVADAVIILKQRAEGGLVAHYAEIRKTRGAPHTVAEVAYSIRPETGPVFLAPVSLEEVVEKTGRRIPLLLPDLEEAIGELEGTESIYVEYPSYWRSLDAALLMPAIFLANGLKVLFVSYRYPSHTIRNILEKYLTNGDNTSELAEKVSRYLDKLLVAKSINPFAYSLAELNALENELIIQHDPGAVVFHGVELAMRGTASLKRYVTMLYNQIMLVKSMGKMVVRLSSSVSRELSRINLTLADLVLKPRCRDASCRDYELYVWHRFKQPIVLDSRKVEGYRATLSEILAKKLPS